MSDNNTLDLTEITSEPVESNIQVDIVDAPETEEPEEVPEEVIEEVPEEVPEEVIEPAIATPDPVEPVEDPEPVIATPDPVAVIATPDPEPVIATPDPEPVIATPDPEPVETVRTEEPVAPVSPAAPVEQVAADIRSILTEVPTAVESVDDSSGLSDDLKQRISELDYLRECCGNWVGSGRRGKSNFLTAWENKSVSVDSSINYEEVLVQLEKFPEIIRLWAERKVTTDSNHFKNIESYTLTKSLFNEKSNGEKVEVLEQLITLLTDCANGKIGSKDIILIINNLY